ncbi:SDR family oxidoreductase [Phytomonospora sp. NPDC050363]|uniref:SDR family oxidoreductase n=1 Tax=Phytomonospora sp. NPDC050363 TaxID=3155642 RepID=UPI0033DB0492
MTTILVTGGTGLLGRSLLDRLKPTGARLRALSRQDRPDADGVTWRVCDLHSGAGLAEALDGVDVIVHCASEPEVPGADVETTRTLIDAAVEAATPHFVYISIVGIDDIPYRYYKDKRCCERMIRESGLPWTTLRTTQFHQFVASLVDRVAKLPTPIMLVPKGTCQPVDVDDVASRLAELAQGSPAGRVDDLGGPQIFSLARVVRDEMRRRGSHRPVVSTWFPGKMGAAIAAGHFTTPAHAGGTVTWGQYVGDNRAL